MQAIAATLVAERQVSAGLCRRLFRPAAAPDLALHNDVAPAHR